MKNYLEIRDVMRILGVSRTTAYAYIHSGRLRSFKVGRLVRIREIDLKHFIEGHPSRENTD